MEKTINEVFINRHKKYGARVAVEKKRGGRWESATWNQYFERSRAIGLALRALGVEKGDRVAILSENRLEWLYADMGSLGAGYCVVPVYTTLTSEEVEYIVKNAEANVLFVEDKVQLEKALALAKNCPLLKKIVVMNKSDLVKDPLVMGFDEMIEMGLEAHKNDPGLFEKLSLTVKAEDLATIVYTSGTTGVPKGAMITHNNIMAVIRSLEKIKPKFADYTDQTCPFLPLSHVFERVAGHFYGTYVGLTASYAESILTFARDVKEKRPTVILAVPRVCEKVYHKITMQVEGQPQWKRKMFHWGHDVGVELSELREKKKPIPLLLSLKYKIAFQLIFKKLSQALGGRVRWMTASGAPTSREMLLFFNAAGIMVIEGYGMTECCAPATMSNLNDYRIGTVGKPLPDVEVKIADDGEVLVKGENVFAGYWKMDKETRESFTEDGFFRSGDIGEFRDGFLAITDRKKDLIITSGGKNVAPQKIEGLFKFDPLFSQFIVVGDRKKYLSALVNINLEQAEQLARNKGIPFGKPEDLLENDQFLALIDNRIAERNTHLARYETIKKYKIIKNEFSQETGELTASLKMKKNVIYKKYQELIDSMYSDD